MPIPFMAAAGIAKGALGAAKKLGLKAPSFGKKKKKGGRRSSFSPEKYARRLMKEKMKAKIMKAKMSAFRGM